jgi:hypothetical protein
VLHDEHVVSLRIRSGREELEIAELHSIPFGHSMKHDALMRLIDGVGGEVRYPLFQRDGRPGCDEQFVQRLLLGEGAAREQGKPPAPRSTRAHRRDDKSLCSPILLFERLDGPDAVNIQDSNQRQFSEHYGSVYREPRAPIGGEQVTMWREYLSDKLGDALALTSQQKQGCKEIQEVSYPASRFNLFCQSR